MNTALAHSAPCSLAALPPDVQYERLTSPGGMGGELAQLKAFLGIDPALPSSQLPLTNYKHVHTGHGPDAVRPAGRASSPDFVGSIVSRSMPSLSVSQLVIAAQLVITAPGWGEDTLSAWMQS